MIFVFLRGRKGVWVPANQKKSSYHSCDAWKGEHRADLKVVHGAFTHARTHARTFTLIGPPTKSSSLIMSKEFHAHPVPHDEIDPHQACDRYKQAVVMIVFDPVEKLSNRMEEK